MCSQYCLDSSAQVVPVPNLGNLKETHQVHSHMLIPAAGVMESKGLMSEGG